MNCGGPDWKSVEPFSNTVSGVRKAENTDIKGIRHYTFGVFAPRTCSIKVVN